jgi:hypothetical protein
VDKPQNLLYLRLAASVEPVDKNVDNSEIPVDRMWITSNLSTGQLCPQNYPQVYPQVLPLLSTGLSTSYIAIYSSISPVYEHSYIVFHRLEGLSTSSVDKSPQLWIKIWELSTGSVWAVDGLWITLVIGACVLLQSMSP